MKTVSDAVAEALRYYNESNFPAMEGACSEVLKLDPENPDALQMLGLWERKRGNYQKAATHLSIVTQRHPSIAQAHLLLGQSYEALGQIDKAAESFGRAAALNPNNSVARDMYAQTLMQQWFAAMKLRRIGREALKTYAAKLQSGFIQKYLSGQHILDIGYRGHSTDSDPIVAQAIGIDLNYPGYDGLTLPFANGSQDAVYSSHCLEHMMDPVAAIREWHRVLRPGGHIVAAVPHQHLYERKPHLPSRWNAEHKQFFTPAKLLEVFERALAPNSYRIRHLCDNDFLYDYSIPPDQHPVWCYEIEIVVEKITPPSWSVG
jgi:tetratricopeptide (TPR) repeat protein